jgi:hypothetical protein
VNVGAFMGRKSPEDDCPQRNSGCVDRMNKQPYGRFQIRVAVTRTKRINALAFNTCRNTDVHCSVPVDLAV